MTVCYVCLKFVNKTHDCEAAKSLIENPTDLGSSYVVPSAVMTRQRQGQG